MAVDSKHAGRSSFFYEQIYLLQKQSDKYRLKILFELYQCFTKKRYKADDFGTFAKAYRMLKQNLTIHYHLGSLRKYFGYYNAFYSAGIELELVLFSPINRLLLLKAFLLALSKNEIRKLLHCPQTELKQ